MIKIALATIFYQCATELQRLVDSIPPKVIDYWITVDGPFRYNLDMNPQLPHKSNDGSLMVISNSAPKFNNAVIIEYKEGATEFDKRNTYLDICKKLKGEIDAIIIVDSDEYFIYSPGLEPLAAWQRFKKNIELEMIQHPHHNVYGIPYVHKDSPSDTYKPRIWVHPEKMRYINGSHYHYANWETEKQDIENFAKYGSTYCTYARSIIKGGVIMTQDQNLRTQEYQDQRKRYQQYLVRYEELIQQSQKYTQEEADRIARESPSSDFDPT